MKIINMKKFNKVLILPLLVFVLANCAGTNVTTYSSASIMLDDFIEQNGGKGEVNDETLHYPLIGTSFIGVSSVGLNPEVAEFRKLKLVLEELNTTSILKCTPPEVMRTP